MLFGRSNITLAHNGLSLFDCCECCCMAAMSAAMYWCCPAALLLLGTCRSEHPDDDFEASTMSDGLLDRRPRKRCISLALTLEQLFSGGTKKLKVSPPSQSALQLACFVLSVPMAGMLCWRVLLLLLLL